MSWHSCVVLLFSTYLVIHGKDISIVDHGAAAGSNNFAKINAHAIMWAFGNSTAGDTIVVPKENLPFYVLGGVQLSNLHNITFQIDGSMYAEPNFKEWPNDGRHYLNFLQFSDCTHLTVTSSQNYGLIDGQGVGWWDREILDLLKYGRPKLFVIQQTTNILFEKVHMINSPSYHLLLSDVAEVEVRYVEVHVERKLIKPLKERMSAKRLKTLKDPPHVLQPEDLNTDGIDPSGKNVYVHDCLIDNDDDSIAVKPCSADCKYSSCSENMLFERLTMTGFGASIGSVPPRDPPNCVRNITFRNCTMPESGKGIYVKSNPSCDEAGINGKKKSFITDITYEDFEIIKPRWWAIWIGPQQQHEPHSTLGRKCALDFPIDPHCPTQGCTTFTNITLSRVYVKEPWLSPGVILGNETNPMKNIVLNDVVFDKPGAWPYHSNYLCEYADVKVTGGTSPVPACKKA